MIRITHLLDRIHLHPASLENLPSLYRIFIQTEPNECYHLAAQSFVSYSFDDEFSTTNIDVNGTHHMLSALKEASPRCRFYFAATSEMFGRAEETPQSERTRFHPRSAYGISKVAGFELTRNYREAYGIHASSGILFNHESPRRGYEFVTRKITSGLARIRSGEMNQLVLGNLEARRDWGHSRDYVRAMWLMLQQPEPDDYVIATGETHSVGAFAELAFSSVGLDYRDFVTTSPGFFRAAEVDLLSGDSAKAARNLRLASGSGIYWLW